MLLLLAHWRLIVGRHILHLHLALRHMLSAISRGLLWSLLDYDLNSLWLNRFRFYWCFFFLCSGSLPCSGALNLVIIVWATTGRIKVLSPTWWKRRLLCFAFIFLDYCFRLWLLLLLLVILLLLVRTISLSLGSTIVLLLRLVRLGIVVVTATTSWWCAPGREPDATHKGQ
jgi:hypothetical protein